MRAPEVAALVRSATALEAAADVKTDAAYWLHLGVLHAGLTERISYLPDRPRQSLIEIALSSAVARLDNFGRKVLIFEAALLRRASGLSLTVDEFATRLRNDQQQYLTLLDRYQALDDLANLVVAQAIEFYAQFATQLVDDWTSVASHLGKPTDLASLTFEVERSETHGNGRGVVTVFADTQPVALYKPRDLSLEAAVTAELANYAAADSVLDGWILPQYFCRGNYGWVQWVPQAPCDSDQAIANYYERAGALIAFAVAFGISDLHSGNIIACGASPIPIDLEATLQHRQRPEGPSRRGAYRARVMEWNSLATGLLPLWLWKGEDFHGVDLSGLGGVDDQWCSIALMNVDDRGQAQERILRDGVELFPNKNVVRRESDGSAVPPWEHIEHIQNGYDRGTKILTGNPSALRASIATISELKARYLVKPTAGYHYAIQASLHPTLMMDQYRRSEYLRSTLNVESPNAAFLEAEINACLIGDVPRFCGAPAEYEVAEDANPAKTVTLPPTDYELGVESALADVEWLSDDDRLHFEMELIEGSLLALSTSGGKVPKPEFGRTGSAFSADTDTKSAAAVGLNFLQRFKARWPDHREWYGFRSSPNGYYEFGLVGLDAYSGASGILGAMRRLSPQDALDEEFVAVLEDAKACFDTNTGPKLGGAYFGLLSALPIAAAALADSEKRDDAKQYIDAIASAHLRHGSFSERSPHYWGPDFLGGRAGGMLVFAQLASSGMLDADKANEIISRLSSDLIDESHKHGQTLVWRRHGISEASDLGLGGLSHGQAGIALAFAVASACELIGDSTRERCRDQIGPALRWEYERFDSRTSLFADVRISSNSPRGEFAWSHGTPGIVLALREIDNLTPGIDGVTDLLSQINIYDAFAAHRAQNGSPVNPSICHGSLGSLLLLWRLSGSQHWCDVPEIAEIAPLLRLEDWIEFDTREARRQAIDAPGLMVGRAGNALGWHVLDSGRIGDIPFLPSDWASLTDSSTGQLL